MSRIYKLKEEIAEAKKKKDKNDAYEFSRVVKLPWKMYEKENLENFKKIFGREYDKELDGFEDSVFSQKNRKV